MIAGRPRPGGGINLRDLLEEDIISAGEDVLSVEYKGNVTYATLSPAGHILCTVRKHDHMRIKVHSSKVEYN